MRKKRTRGMSSIEVTHSDIYERVANINDKVHAVEMKLEKQLGHIYVCLEHIKTTQNIIKYVVIAGLFGLVGTFGTHMIENLL